MNLSHLINFMSSPSSLPEPPVENQKKSYWRANLKLLGAILSIWFLVSFGAGIIFVEPLNSFKMGGFPLGFWMGQQGSIYVFVVLILIYAVTMDWLDRRHGVDESADEPGEEVPHHEL